eukprot:CFRG8590T1
MTGSGFYERVFMARPDIVKSVISKPKAQHDVAGTNLNSIDLDNHVSPLTELLLDTKKSSEPVDDDNTLMDACVDNTCTTANLSKVKDYNFIDEIVDAAVVAAGLEEPSPDTSSKHAMGKGSVIFSNSHSSLVDVVKSDENALETINEDTSLPRKPETVAKTQLNEETLRELPPIKNEQTAKCTLRSSEWHVWPKSKNLTRAATLQADEYISEFFHVKQLEIEMEDTLQSTTPDAGSGATDLSSSLPTIESTRLLPTNVLKRAMTYSHAVAEIGTITWGLPIKTVFRLCTEYVGNGQVKLTYENRSRLFALKRQALKGQYDDAKMGELGWFDWVGHDIKRHWIELGDMSSDIAMAQFCKVVESDDESWKEYLLNEKQKLDEELNTEWCRAKEEMLKAKAIYLEKQQHIAEELERKKELQRRCESSMDKVSVPSTNIPDDFKQQDVLNRSLSLPYNPTDSRTLINFEEWKSQVITDPDNCLVVPRGECVVIHVPASAANTTTWWEYATEAYDISFAVDFEYINENGETVVQPILPPFRHELVDNRRITRGSHTTHRKGTYLLKFDNSYSLWRSKTVFYRLYAT